MSSLQAEFEVWAMSRGYKLFKQHGEYYYSMTICAWVAWQASRKSASIHLPHVNDTDSAPMLRDYITKKLAEAGISYE